MRKFNPAGVTPHPFYSHGAEVLASERLVFIAGQVGQRADGSIGEGIAEQVAIATENLKNVLAAADMTLADVVKFTIYLTDQSHYEGFVGSAAGLLSNPPAPTTLLFVKGLASPALFIEIEAVAAK